MNKERKFYFAGRVVRYRAAGGFLAILHARRRALKRAEAEFARSCERAEFYELCACEEDCHE